MSAEGLRAWQARAWASVLAAVIASAASGMVATSGCLSCVALGMPAGVDGAAHVAVVAEMLMYQDRSVLPTTLWCLVD